MESQENHSQQNATHLTSVGTQCGIAHVRDTQRAALAQVAAVGATSAQTMRQASQIGRVIAKEVRGVHHKVTVAVVATNE